MEENCHQLANMIYNLRIK